ncbi:MAG TPA: hypothetical protein PLL78_09225 [Fimbriimonadaceae bacterium]|nr:hypothetical protein [Fimbriimonadaceae bacterium]
MPTTDGVSLIAKERALARDCLFFRRVYEREGGDARDWCPDEPLMKCRACPLHGQAPEYPHPEHLS